MNEGGSGCGKNRTWPVCSKRRGDSVSGLCDMGGNVWELTSSIYGSGHEERVLRGGSWNIGNREARMGFEEGQQEKRDGFVFADHEEHHGIGAIAGHSHRARVQLLNDLAFQAAATIIAMVVTCDGRPLGAP